MLFKYKFAFYTSVLRFLNGVTFPLRVYWAFTVSLSNAHLMSVSASFSKVCFQNCLKTNCVLTFHFLVAAVDLSSLSRV